MKRSALHNPLAWLALGAVACSNAPVAPASDASVADIVDARPRVRAVDLLFVVDDSNTMYGNQETFAQNLGAFFEALQGGDPATAVTSLHLGVVSTDLGTPGSMVPSCTDAEQGDDGLLNPIRNGPATRTHRPWTITASPVRSHCSTNPEQYPAFLTFEAGDAAVIRQDFVCNVILCAGCGLEQPLEAAYRALITQRSTNNQGFLRTDALLGIFILSDEEDGSTRDCRYAEPGVACRQATSVFDPASPDWASSDLNLRFYTYIPGGETDPTWPLERYFDFQHPSRGFLGLKPGHPDWVIFGGLLGIPLELPRAQGRVDWNTLLGSAPDGSDGYAGMSPEGPISMRHHNMDPQCSTRVVPACRRQGSTYDPSNPPCDTTVQYYAWPARRLAEIARRFDESFQNSYVGSICQTDYSESLRAYGSLLRNRFAN